MFLLLNTVFLDFGSYYLAGIILKETPHVANLGDSHAVIETMIVNKKIHVEQLTKNHNCNYSAVREELKSMHPGDPTIVKEKNGVWHVKGIIMVSRSLSDAYMKRPEFTESFLKFKKMPEPFTRGVVSAEPDMHTKVLTDSDKFLIFASDGLWDFLSNEQVVEIVEKNQRNGIAKRLVSTVLAEVAGRRNVIYNNMMHAILGHGLVAHLLPIFDVVDNLWLGPLSWQGIGCTTNTKARNEGYIDGNIKSRSYPEKKLVFCFGSYIASQMLLPFGEENLLSSSEMQPVQELVYFSNPPSLHFTQWDPGGWSLVH
jgi:serine/threonine protein phosphatase PrpC